MSQGLWKTESTEVRLTGQEGERGGFKSGCKSSHWQLDEQLSVAIWRLQSGSRAVGGGQKRSVGTERSATSKEEGASPSPMPGGGNVRNVVKNTQIALSTPQRFTTAVESKTGPAEKNEVHK